MPPEFEHVIRIRGLVNRFGSQVVHDQLELDVRRDEILGVVGDPAPASPYCCKAFSACTDRTKEPSKCSAIPSGIIEPGPHKKWGVLFQGGALLSGLTVQENVELPIALHSNLPVETRRELAVLKIFMVGLDLNAAGKYPNELSGGMRKRASLARALALEPKLLFLDEPTAGLDPISATEFDQLISYLHANLDLTIVMITHDVDTLFSVCDRVAVLVNKGIIVDTLEELVKHPDPWIQEYFGDPRAVRGTKSGHCQGK